MIMPVSPGSSNVDILFIKVIGMCIKFMQTPFTFFGAVFSFWDFFLFSCVISIIFFVIHSLTE